MATVQTAVLAMGTRFEIILVGPDETHLRASAEAATDEIEQWDLRLSAFRKDSTLAHVNRHAAMGGVRLDDELFELLALAQSVFEQSEGAFDITIGALMRQLGFREAPPSNELEAPVAYGMQHVEFLREARSIHFNRAGLELDLGGIAKGFAVDAAVEIMRDADVDAGLIHGGTSTARAWGRPATTKDWRIEIRDARLDSKAGSAGRGPVVCLRDASLSVSAPHGRTVQRDAESIGHVLDPRTGQSVQRRGFAAIIGPSAAETDAWSTALLVQGRRTDAMPRRLTSIQPGGVRAEDGYTVHGDRTDAIILPDWVRDGP